MRFKDPVTTTHLTEWVTIEMPQVNSDDQGGYTKEWVPVHQGWARIDPVMPTLQDEAWHVEQHISACRYRLWIRNEYKLEPSCRIQWGESILIPLSAPVYIQKRLYQTVMMQLQSL